MSNSSPSPTSSPRTTPCSSSPRLRSSMRALFRPHASFILPRGQSPLPRARFVDVVYGKSPRMPRKMAQGRQRQNRPHRDRSPGRDPAVRCQRLPLYRPASIQRPRSRRLIFDHRPREVVPELRLAEAPANRTRAPCLASPPNRPPGVQDTGISWTSSLARPMK